MASSLKENKEEGVFGICSKELWDPIDLPCLHEFCFEVMEDCYKLDKDELLVVCPFCKNSAKIPDRELRNFPRLLMVTSSKKTGDLDEESKESDVICSTCGKTSDVHCVNCKKPLCQPCNTHQNAFTKDHKIVPVKELQSAKAAEEGRICEMHGEQVRYYCETEQRQACPVCVSLDTCSIEHKRITLKEAAKTHTSSFEDLVEKCTVTKEKIQDAIKDIKKVLDDLTQSSSRAIADLDRRQYYYITKLEQEVNKQKDKIRKLEEANLKEMGNTLKALMVDVDRIEEACDEVSKLNQARSDYLTTHRYSSLSAKLKSLSESLPEKVDTEKGHIQIGVANIDLPVFARSMNKTEWKFSRRFHPQGFNTLACVAINHDGDIAVGSWERGVKLYTKLGHEKGTIRRHYTENRQVKDPGRLLGVADIAVTPDNRYIIAPVGKTCIQFHDCHGKYMYTSHVKNVNNVPSNVNSVAVDETGRVILGLYGNTISIHYADGSLISRFATEMMPSRLAVTSNNEIVCSFYENGTDNLFNLQLMDYSGSNIRVIQPPAEVKIWSPFYVRCRQGELFVVNSDDGDPVGIYRYTDTGVYLSCITTKVNDPAGIELSNDGMELLVTDRSDNMVKVFCTDLT